MAKALIPPSGAGVHGADGDRCGCGVGQLYAGRSGPRSVDAVRRGGTSRDLPALLLWGSNGVVGAQTDPLEAWRPWLPRITGRAVPTGHFMVEERPDEVLAEIQEHLAAAAQN